MAVKRKLSTKGKVITTLIYLLAIAMVVLVIYLNQHPEATEKVVPDVLSNTTTTTEFDKSDLPYNAEGSDKYAGIEPAYKFGDIELRTEGDKKVAYYNNQKAENYTGVCTERYMEFSHTPAPPWYFSPIIEQKSPLINPHFRRN